MRKKTMIGIAILLVAGGTGFYSFFAGGVDPRHGDMYDKFKKTSNMSNLQQNNSAPRGTQLPASSGMVVPPSQAAGGDDEKFGEKMGMLKKELAETKLRSEIAKLKKDMNEPDRGVGGEIVSSLRQGEPQRALPGMTPQRAEAPEGARMRKSDRRGGAEAMVPSLRGLADEDEGFDKPAIRILAINFGARSAVLQAGEQQITHVREGERLGRFSVKRIDHDSVTVLSAGEEMVLYPNVYNPPVKMDGSGRKHTDQSGQGQTQPQVAQVPMLSLNPMLGGQGTPASSMLETGLGAGGTTLSGGVLTGGSLPMNQGIGTTNVLR